MLASKTSVSECISYVPWDREFLYWIEVWVAVFDVGDVARVACAKEMRVTRSMENSQVAVEAVETVNNMGG